MATLKGDGASFFQILIGAVIAISFLIVIANSIVAQTTTASTVNETVTIPAADSATDLVGRTLLVAGQINNVSAPDPLISENLTLRTGLGSDGLQTVQLFLNTSSPDSEVNVTYTYEPDGYLNTGSSRAIAALILIFGALGILMFVFVTLMKEGSMGKLIGRN